MTVKFLSSECECYALNPRTSTTYYYYYNKEKEIIKKKKKKRIKRIERKE